MFKRFFSLFVLSFSLFLNFNFLFIDNVYSLNGQLELEKNSIVNSTDVAASGGLATNIKIQDIITNGLNIVLGLAATVSVGFIIFGASKVVMANGDTSVLKKSMGVMAKGAIATLMISSSFVVSKFVINQATFLTQKNSINDTAVSGYGSLGQYCDSSTPCSSNLLFCNPSNKCVLISESGTCGKSGQAPCAGSSCDSGFSADMRTGVCVKCGDLNSPCCNFSPIANTGICPGTSGLKCKVVGVSGDDVTGKSAVGASDHYCVLNKDNPNYVDNGGSSSDTVNPICNDIKDYFDSGDRLCHACFDSSANGYGYGYNSGTTQYNSGDCMFCAKNQIFDASVHSCIDCPISKIGNSSNQCVDTCPSGKFFNYNTKTCLDCVVDSVVCSNCSVSSTSQNAFFSSAGRIDNDSKSCDLSCNSGYAKSSITGNFTCVPITSGNYGADGASNFVVMGAVQQLPCPAGKYCYGGSEAPKTVSLGYFATANTSTKVYNASTGSVDQVPCKMSSSIFCSGGANSPVALVDGKNPLDENARAVTSINSLVAGVEDCNIGNYCDVANLASNKLIQQPCPVGYGCSVTGISSSYGATNRLLGYACSSGTYQDKTGQSDCLPCPSDKYQDLTGQKNCKIPSNGYIPSADRKSQVLCPIGSYCLSGIVMSCPVGTYANYTAYTPSPLSYTPVMDASTKCIPCPAGYGCNSVKDSTTGIETKSGLYNYTGCDPIADPKCFAKYLCPAGYYCSGGATSPIHIGEGYYPVNSFGYALITAGAANKLPCTPGYYCPLDATSGNQLGKTVCDFGYYCSGGVGSRKIVPPGYYASIGLSSHIYTSSGAVEKYPCAVGYACVGYGADQSACPAGKYQDKTGQTSCITCPVGTYQDLAAKTLCNQIPSGKVSLDKMTISSCPAGSVPNITKDGCNSCPIGQYAKTSTKTCAPCPVGYMCESVGIDEATLSSHMCTPGTYQDKTGQSSCDACPPGYFCTGSSPKAQCDAGTYRATPGAKIASECTPCPAGSICPRGSVSPNGCLVGEYGVLVSGLSVCQRPIPAGYASSVSGLTGVELFSNIIYRCPSGYYCPGNNVKTAVGQGYYASNASGVYVATVGAVKQTSCPVGKFCLGGASAPTDCIAGQYQNSQGKSSCINVMSGYYASKDNVGNTYNASTGSTFQVKCNQGYYCIGGSNAPTACVYGYACKDYGISDVTLPSYLCPAGEYQDDNVCKPCPAGHGCSVSGISSSALSPKKLSDYICAVGKYQNQTGKTSCISIPSGYFASIDGSSHSGLVGSIYSIICPKGYMCVGGNSNKQPCLNGFYQNTEGRSSCSTAQPGYFVSADGTTFNSSNATISSISQVACARGYKCPGGAGVPVACDMGTYQDQTGKSSCISCTSGTYQDETGKTSCKVCSPGSYCTMSYVTPNSSSWGAIVGLSIYGPTEAASDRVGAVGKTECPAGSYSAYSSGNSSCGVCQNGKYSEGYGNNSCSPCLNLVPAHATYASCLSLGGSYLWCTKKDICPWSCDTGYHDSYGWKSSSEGALNCNSYCGDSIKDSGESCDNDIQSNGKWCQSCSVVNCTNAPAGASYASGAANSNTCDWQCPAGTFDKNNGKTTYVDGAKNCDGSNGNDIKDFGENCDGKSGLVFGKYCDTSLVDTTNGLPGIIKNCNYITNLGAWNSAGYSNQPSSCAFSCKAGYCDSANKARTSSSGAVNCNASGTTCN